MRRIAAYRIASRIAVLFALLVCLPYSSFAAPKRGIIIRVKDSAQLQTLVSRYGLNLKKLVGRDNGGLLVVEGNDANYLKNQLKHETSVAFIEENTLIPLDNGETVLPLDNGETVLPLGATIMPLD